MINSPPLPVSVMTTAIKWSGDPVKVELPPTDIPPKVYEAARTGDTGRTSGHVPNCLGSRVASSISPKNNPLRPN